MAKLARLPGIGRSDAEADVPRVPRLRTRYYAFLSYSHKDKELADWLHRELERFRVPSALAGKLTANGVVPRRLVPVFRDQQDLSAGADLAEEIKAALAASQFLIVLCSPTAAKSRWTNQEIESFKRTRPEGCVLAAVASGEPFASDLPGHEDEECFPPALRYKYDRRGHQTAKRAEPLAADFREDAEGKRLAFLKLVAGMLGVGLDELVRREQTRQHRRLAWLAAASLAGMAVTSTLAIAAFQARNEAREQRREAEGLVSFMLGDLKDKLEPIGRLDALDGVGSKVLAYYSKQDASQLSDAGLSQRSKALALMAAVANSRGDTDTSLKLYREAIAGTAEAMRRNPSDGQAVFDHAQNVFYIGEIALNRSDFDTAETSMREYKRLALQMVSLQPDSMKYRMEEQYADADLGIVLYSQRKYPEAVDQFRSALDTMQAIATADRGNRGYRESVAESLAWLADAERATGHYDQAISLRQRDIATLDALLNETGDVDYRQRLIPAHRALGSLYAERGQGELASQQFAFAIDHADKLALVEPNNALWIGNGVKARIDLTKQLLAEHRESDALAQIQVAEKATRSLLQRDPKNPEWRKTFSSLLAVQARLAEAAGENERSLALAHQALQISQSVHTSDVVDDSSRVARLYRFIGDIQRNLGRMDDARSSWNAALAAFHTGSAEQPDELAEHAIILQRVGRQSEAERLNRQLLNIGFRADTT